MECSICEKSTKTVPEPGVSPATPSPLPSLLRVPFSGHCHQSSCLLLRNAVLPMLTFLSAIPHPFILRQCPAASLRASTSITGLFSSFLHSSSLGRGFSTDRMLPSCGSFLLTAYSHAICAPGRAASASLSDSRK